MSSVGQAVVIRRELFNFAQRRVFRLERPADERGESSAFRPAGCGSAEGVRYVPSMVSMCPNIMVMLVRIPILCACRMTSRYWAVLVLPTPTLLRTRSERISAPPPGTVSRPASCSLQKYVADRHVENLVERVNLRWAERVDVDCWIVGFNKPH